MLKLWRITSTDVIKIKSLFFKSGRLLNDAFSVTMFCLPRCLRLEDVLKMPWKLRKFHDLEKPFSNWSKKKKNNPEDK